MGKTLTAALLAGVASIASTAANAATAAAADGPSAGQTQVEQIVVTARRQEENLQRTPVAVTATTGASLDRAQITRVDQLQNIAPGLVVQPAVAQPGSAAFSLRGQASPDGLIAVDQSVGVYADGVYVARSSGALFNFVDVERVEVLRGPQGTLFGRNTTGGAINLISKKPTAEFEGMARLRYGNFGAWEATGMANLPIVGDQLAFRGVFQHSQHDGYGHNLAFNQSIGSDKTDFFRGSLLIAPHDQIFRALIEGDYTDRRTGGEIVGLKSFTPTGTNGALVAICSGPNARATCPFKGPAGDSLANYAVDVIGKGHFWDVYNSMPGIYGNAKTGGLSATVDIDLAEHLKLKSITAWRAIRTAAISDNDGTPYVFSGGLALTDGNFIKQDQISQELQLTGDILDGRLNYIGGAFYFAEHGLDKSKSYSVFPLSAALGYNEAYVRNRSSAVYGQLTYKITDDLRFTGGLRYTDDYRWIKRMNRAENPGNSGNFTCSMAASTLDPGVFCQATNDKSFNYVSYTAGFDWQAMEGVFLYAKTSRAYKSGGFNTRAVTGGPAVGFAPEKVTDYETGAKLDLLDRRMRFNAAAFYTDYQNVQRNVPVVVPGSTVLSSGIQNAATAEIKGLEVELTVLPVRGLQLSAAATFLDPKYKTFNVPLTPTTSLDVSATPFNYAPKVAYTLSADYTTPVGPGDLNLHLDYAYRGTTYSVGPLVGAGLFGATNPDTNRIPGYGLINGQATLTLQGGRLELGIFGRNLGNTKYYQRFLALQDTALGITAYLPGDPRTYGAEVTYRF
ncbi:TonB-dependent receptor [Phenylobacterium sp.]|uniref:TonB-dependent receptor n=1 Tax=Phenylobacterium sp. TaxID=1871053 RepID=UPI002DE3E5E5|nr:TonB-dependent receptor [Phenylobacterium sp.]